MRHAKKRLQLNRFTSWRKATLKSMARNIFTYQSITTTLTKAKAARPLIERLISLAKENTLAAKRRAYQVLGDHKLVSLLFNDIGKRFSGRNGGYVRILNLGNRRGDDARLVLLELTEIKKEKRKVAGLKKEKETKPKDEPKATKKIEEATIVEEKHEDKKPPLQKKPTKKFFGGIKNIFKKERDSL